MKLVINTSFQR